MFPWVAYLTDIYQFWTLAALWEQCTGNLFISHQLFLNVTQVTGITSVHFLIGSRLIIVFPQLVYSGWADKWCVRVCVCMDSQYHSAHDVPEVCELWASVIMARQTFEECTWVRMFVRWNICWNSVTLIRMTPCTVNSYWHFGRYSSRGSLPFWKGDPVA
jgi:hypothetical protein